MTYTTLRQIACPTPSSFASSKEWDSDNLNDWVRRRVLELTYTSYRIRPYAVDVVAGLTNQKPDDVDPGQPFHWIPERRAQLQAELDAAMLHLYGLDRSETEHVLDSFFVLRKYDERDYGEFRTKRLVLTAYDAMAEAARTGTPYRSPLDPPPGDGPRHPEPTS